MSDVGGTAIVRGPYRYLLTRNIDGADPARAITWVMLNPSTADALKDDPTIRRVIGFSKRWGYGHVRVVNLFALRATHPIELQRVEDPVGADNDHYMEQALLDASHVVLGWGNDGKLCDMRYRFQGYSCLGTTKSGEPRHPLRLAYATERKPWCVN